MKRKKSKSKKIGYCIDCSKKLANYRAKRCIFCDRKQRRKNYYCIDCGKEISWKSKRCKKCHLKFNKGKNHPSYNPEYHKKHYCIEPDCDNEICKENYRIGSRRCRKCAGKLQSKRMLENPFNSKSIAKHHIYLKDRKETTRLTFSKHAKLHSAAYEYLYIIQGKKGIDKYLKWFDRKYGLK